MSQPSYRPPIEINESKGIARIPLTRGLWTVVDLSDMVLVSGKNWHANGGGYANRREGSEMVFMHHLILPRKQGFDVDHIDGDKRNNRRSNLRYATRSENKANHPEYFRTKAKHAGVSWDSQRQKWMVTITLHKKTLRLGRFSDLKHAIAVREKAELEVFGEYRYGVSPSTANA